MNEEGSEKTTGANISARTESELTVAEVYHEQLRLDNEPKGENKNGKPQKESKDDNGEDRKLQEESKDDLAEWFVKVKTKTNDGGSPATENEYRPDNAFSRYSNRNVRMMHLLGPPDNNDDGDANNEAIREGEANPDANARKTRLSTELHVRAFLNEHE